MNSKDRINAVLNDETPDHVPLTTWCFGLKPMTSLVWECDGVRREHWYSLRMEHLHTLPGEWSLDDEFKRADAWKNLGVDDVIDAGHHVRRAAHHHPLPCVDEQHNVLAALGLKLDCDRFASPGSSLPRDATIVVVGQIVAQLPKLTSFSIVARDPQPHLVCLSAPYERFVLAHIEQVGVNLDRCPCRTSCLEGKQS